jgi:hypothetical protein
MQSKRKPLTDFTDNISTGDGQKCYIGIKNSNQCKQELH